MDRNVVGGLIARNSALIMQRVEFVRLCRVLGVPEEVWVEAFMASLRDAHEVM